MIHQSFGGNALDTLELIRAAVRHAPTQISGGMDGFTVTDAGQIHVMKESPKPPKQTEGQKRYDAFLRADCGMTFGDWLRIGSQP